MEENNKDQVIVDIGVDAMIKSLQRLQIEFQKTKDEVAKFDEQLEKGEITQEEYDKAIIRNTQEQKVWQQQIRAAEKDLQNSIKAEQAQDKSLVQLRAQLALLNKQYDSMEGMERMGEAGENLRKKIKTLSDNISSLEANTGRYQRNVGNYKSALEGLSGGFKAAGLSTKGLDQSLKLLNGNPIMLFLTAIVTIVRQLIQAFKGNEEATMALKQAFSAFNPIIDAAKRGLEAFANIIVKVVTGAVNGLTSAIGWLLDKVQDIGNFFGADWHMGDNFREGVAAAKELQAAENEYIKAKRAWSVESAKIDREVADLREKASDKEQYNAQQRLAFLDKAIALETRKAEKDKELAQQNLANLQAEAQRSANSASMNEKLAEAERAVIEADTRLADTKRNLNRQRQQAINEINGVTSTTVRNTKAVKDNTNAVADNAAEMERQAKEYQDKTVAEMQKAEDALNSIIIDAFAKRRAVEETAYQRKKETLTAELEAEREAHGEGTALFNAYNLQFEALEEQHAMTMADIKADEAAKEAEINRAKEEDAAKTAERIKQIEKSRLEYSAQIASGLSDLMESVAGDNKEMVKASKIVALAEVAIKQGVAIAEAVASAAAGDPYTYALRVAAAVASTVAAMASAIASINKASSFETGGVIGGYRGATMGSDNTYIHARQGEMVLNAEQQRQLFDIANGGYSSNMMAQLVEAIQAMPAPVLDYQEFTSFQRRVTQMTENAKLN